MIFAILTLVAALALAAVAGWFSIIGIMSIYAGAAFHALVMGAVLEAGKLVTTSWLYRNWDYSDWRLKTPLIVFTLTLMLATSIGVFGFLSKAHLEQGSSTIDNGAKVERLEQQIARERSVIDDNQKVITQLDATINSYLGKDRTDKSLAVRRAQGPQRKQLREDIEAAQKRIDQFSDEKLKLQSEVRKLQLDVGPIRYIAELIYGADGNTDKNIEAAVRIFTLIIVSTLDPLAVILLVAANHTLLRYQNEKKKNKETVFEDSNTPPGNQGLVERSNVAPPIAPAEESLVAGYGPGAEEQVSQIYTEVLQESAAVVNNSDSVTEKVDYEEESPTLEETIDSTVEDETPPVVFPPTTEQLQEIPTTHETHDTTVEHRLRDNAEPWAHQSTVLRELLGDTPHFVPQKIQDNQPALVLSQDSALPDPEVNKYPKTLSWLNEFRRL